MIYSLNKGVTTHADLLRKQRANLAEMFQLALADLDAAIVDAEAIIGPPPEPERKPEHPATQYQQAAE